MPPLERVQLGQLCRGLDQAAPKLQVAISLTSVAREPEGCLPSSGLQANDQRKRHNGQKTCRPQQICSGSAVANPTRPVSGLVFVDPDKINNLIIPCPNHRDRGYKGVRFDSRFREKTRVHGANAAASKISNPTRQLGVWGYDLQRSERCGRTVRVWGRYMYLCNARRCTNNASA
jgi:hypothetical protein